MPSKLNAQAALPVTRPNPVICAGALSRLIWAAGALLVLWLTVYWALS
ncbi:MAG: hypothetical protein IPN98_05955 [Propionivibrio sp.]|nr:hypothetical protein [Propionivibrio sp.]